MAHALPELPYAKDALAPAISAETVDYHYGKHHQTYVTNLNGLLEGSGLEDMPLEELITVGVERVAADKRTAVFNNAAQVWNHTFYWSCMKKGGGGEPSGDLARAISESFGSVEKFREAFAKAAIGQFGSGWAWLVKDSSGALSVISTSNAATPLTEKKIPLLTCDVWEHAYYIDHRNARAKYVEAWWNNVNWEFVSENYSK
ncbi:MAG TPA: superoxide dismutase [bacterium]|nr:superoxide dismutase [bacterium]